MKKCFYALSTLLVYAIVIAICTYEEPVTDPTVMANIEALTDNEGSHAGGTANKNCPIWNVTYTTGGLGFPIISCSTGGSYKCEAGTCPHGS